MDRNLIRYTVEKTSDLIYKLISGPGDARTRLLDCNHAVWMLLHCELPEECIEVRERVKGKLLNKPEKENNKNFFNSSYFRSVVAMRNKTAGKVIGDIYYIYQTLCCVESEFA